MRVLREGIKGADVSALQERLGERGFPPGPIDGDFGPATTAAVLAFQRSERLLADGIVGPRTARALELEAVDVPAVLPQVTVEIVRQMFPQTPAANIESNLPIVLNALVEPDLAGKKMVLMALATIRAETESFRPISEGQSKFNTSPGGHPFNLYDNRKDLGNQGPPDGERYKGRGFVQLTGRTNYQVHGERIGVPLLEDPDKANDPETAAELLASFLKHKEIGIKEALLDGDLKAARRLVNGGSHGLDRFTEAYNIGDRLIPDELA